jgi:hypothetical protein
MPQEVREHVPEPFVTTKDGVRGRALRSTHNRQAGGDSPWVRARRRHRIRIFLPRVADPSPGPERAVVTRSAWHRDDPRHEKARDVTTRLLEQAGYRVIAVGDAAVVDVADRDDDDLPSRRGDAGRSGVKLGHMRACAGDARVHIRPRR